MNHLEQFFLTKWASMARRVLPNIAELMAGRTGSAIERGAWRAGETFKKPLVLLRGQTGTFWARHAGYSTLGQMPTAMFHAVEDIPGVAAKNTSFPAPAITQAGFRMPKVIPYDAWAKLKQLPGQQGLTTGL